MGQHTQGLCRLPPVKAKDLRDLVHFDPGGPHHESLYETGRMWSEIVCLETNQGLGPISDSDSDGICVCVAGEVAVQVDRGRKRLPQWGSVLIPAGSDLVVTNASEEPAVILLVAAPPPPHRAILERPE